MNGILVGYGEVGKGIRYVIPELDVYDIKFDNKGLKKTYDVLLVAIPYTESFIDEVKKYQEFFKVKSTIIFSTVPIGTSAKLNAVHSPVEGKHPNLGESIGIMRRFVGGTDRLALEFLHQFFPNITIVDKPDFTEFLKLRSTSKYGINIEFARYENAVSKTIGMNFDLIKEFDEAYNELYRDMNMPQFQRYILDPPKGKIGGHCVVPNAKILDEQYPNTMLKEIYQ